VNSKFAKSLIAVAMVNTLAPKVLPVLPKYKEEDEVPEQAQPVANPVINTVNIFMSGATGSSLMSPSMVGISPQSVFVQLDELKHK
jgi:hypothetical protein